MKQNKKCEQTLESVQYELENILRESGVYSKLFIETISCGFDIKLTVCA